MVNDCVSPTADCTGVVGLVGTTRVGFVKVDTVVIYATNEKCGAERTGATVLGERLLEIANLLDEDVHRDRIGVCDSVDL